MFGPKLLLTALSTAALLAGLASARTGDATYYETGLGACGAYSADSDHVVALGPEWYANGGRCWQHIGVNYNGKFVDATVVDLCPGCPGNNIDLSPSAFEALADLDLGRITVDWSFE